MNITQTIIKNLLPAVMVISCYVLLIHLVSLVGHIWI